ncbi:MAG: diguanylate cyclase [Negativicutes bacterium]|nr:diguanylate cyclase [Negativicutes bacterium]
MQRILLMADNENDIGELAGLSANRYELVVANSKKSALKLAAAKGPALVLADLVLAEAQGLCASEFAGRKAARSVPVIFITERNRPEDIAKAFALGGQDYIAKPFFADELHARLGPHLELRQAQVSLQECFAALEQKNHQLRDITEQLESAARIDLLTAIPNRWYMLERMKDEAARSFRYQRSLTIAAVSVDDFTVLVGEHGRDCGDYVLQSIADILRSGRRGQDVVARWEDEVFLLMLPETYIADGGRVAERVRARVEAAGIIYSGQRIPVTVSVGVAEFDAGGGVEGTVEKAEAAVAEGRRTAKNSVVLSQK